MSEILESVLQTVQKQFTYRQYILTDLYRWQCAEYTYIYSVHTVYYLRYTYNYNTRYAAFLHILDYVHIYTHNSMWKKVQQIMLYIGRIHNVMDVHSPAQLKDSLWG